MPGTLSPVFVKSTGNKSIAVKIASCNGEDCRSGTLLPTASTPRSLVVSFGATRFVTVALTVTAPCGAGFYLDCSRVVVVKHPLFCCPDFPLEAKPSAIIRSCNYETILYFTRGKKSTPASSPGRKLHKLCA